jgi:hypothetical protein
MSRYIIPARTPGLVVVVGWDPPLETFFGQVLDKWAVAEEDQCLLWVGDTVRAIPSVEQLEALLGAYGIFTETDRTLLRLDRQTPTQKGVPYARVR